MAFLADSAQVAFRRLLEWWPCASAVVAPVGFALAAFAAGDLFPNSQGSGIPQVIAACNVTDPAARLALISLCVACGKILIMAFGLSCGASIGREGSAARFVQNSTLSGVEGRRNIEPVSPYDAFDRSVCPFPAQQRFRITL